MEIPIDGDWKRLAREMEGFHTQIVYGDYTREVGYALKKLGGQMQCIPARIALPQSGRSYHWNNPHKANTIDEKSSGAPAENCDWQ